MQPTLGYKRQHSNANCSSMNVAMICNMAGGGRTGGGPARKCMQRYGYGRVWSKRLLCAMRRTTSAISGLIAGYLHTARAWLMSQLLLSLLHVPLLSRSCEFSRYWKQNHHSAKTV
jgi:hypothetical protein